MGNRWTPSLLAALLAALFVTAPCGCGIVSESGGHPTSGNPEIAAILREVMAEHDLVGMGAGILDADGGLEIAVAGRRRADRPEKIALDDVWHIGSCAKAMTATLMARLVEEGTLDWDSTLSGIFPELTENPGPPFASVTVEQLLSHRAGLPRDMRYEGPVGRSGTEQRLALLRRAGQEPLEAAPGARYSYSNLGYILAGAVIERVAGRSFEEAIGELLFEPMGMRPIAFEGACPPGEGGHLWSHEEDGEPVSRETYLHNDPVPLRPAGCVRCSLAVWARFIGHHLVGENGGSDYLEPGTYRALHRPPAGEEYALGWSVVERDWAGGTALQHCGSNCFNFANVWIAPRKGFAIFVCINQGDTFEATDAAVARLIALRETCP